MDRNRLRQKATGIRVLQAHLRGLTQNTILFMYFYRIAFIHRAIMVKSVR